MTPAKPQKRIYSSLERYTSASTGLLAALVLPSTLKAILKASLSGRDQTMRQAKIQSLPISITLFFRYAVTLLKNESVKCYSSETHMQACGATLFRQLY